MKKIFKYIVITKYIVNYCSEIWGNTYVTNLNPIYILQKKSMRIISNVGYRDSTNDLFYNLKIVKFYDLIKIKICVAIYKAKYSILPSNLLSLIDLNLNTVYNTSNS